jgi:ATP-dependent DNA ligase
VTLETMMPDWLEPMAATLTQERFTGSDRLFERKFDGIRLLAYKRGADVRVYSRNRLSRNLPDLARAIAGLPAFIEWTVHAKLRHPRLVGVRADKDARDVTREQP